MQIIQQIKTDIIDAMKAGEKERVSALRMVLSALQQAEKDGTEDSLTVLRRERKRRRESEVAYREADRTDLADKEAFEAETIEAYLPAGLTASELDALVNDAIAQTGAEGPKDFGVVMKKVLEASKGRADGKTISTKVKEILA